MLKLGNEGEYMHIKNYEMVHISSMLVKAWKSTIFCIVKIWVSCCFLKNNIVMTRKLSFSVLESGK